MQTTPQTLYLSLGSNQGDRLQYLIDAIQLIEQEDVGNITDYSSVYESASWGFDGASFYNACIEVQYTRPLESILIRLQYIENTLNRRREPQNATQAYQNRTIDLDILLTLDQDHSIIETPRLQVPHPRMHLRQFVLKPLCEIAQNITHPILNKNIQELLENCTDRNTIHCLRGYNLRRLVTNDL